MSRAVSNILLDKEILLESGTNELEVLVFRVGECRFGINVAKVREVLPRQPIINLPMAHSSVRGVFRLREHVVPCVSLTDHLGLKRTSEDAERTSEEAESKLVLTDINQQQTAFLVDEVERIHRLSWEQMMAAPSLVALAHTPITAVTRIEGSMIIMLDFEMVIDQVTGASLCQDVVPNPHGLPRESLRLLLADDSPTVRLVVGATLRRSGYTQQHVFENGAEAWKWIEKTLAETGDPAAVGDLLISDVEMPQVDGFHLTKRIKDHPKLRSLPVLLYSSIVTPDNHKKGAAVGADAQVSKPELGKVVELADELIMKTRLSRQAAEGSVPADGIARQISPGPGAAPQPAPPPARPATASPAAARPAAARPVAAQPAPQHISVPTATAVVAEFAPPRRRGPGLSPPGIDPSLWATFHQELRGRVDCLAGIGQQAEAQGLSEEVRRDALRTLHTVKSAAMVLPCEPISHTTHLLEDLLAPRPSHPGAWPGYEFGQYLAWLQLVTATDRDPAYTLEQGRQVEAELSKALAALANAE